MDRWDFSKKSENEVSGNKKVHRDEGKNTNCLSCYNFKLSSCKEAAAGVSGAECSKWHRVRKETQDLFESYYKMKLWWQILVIFFLYIYS